MLDIIIDFETCSEIDLREVGQRAYAEHPSTRWLCMAYSINGGDVRVIRPGDELPPEFLGDFRFVAWNVEFDLAIWNEVAGFHHVPFERTFDLAVVAATLSLPRKLETCAQALRLGIEKDAEGHRLMMRLCKPVRATKNLSSPWRHHTDDALNRLAEYCAQDLLVEQAIYNLPSFRRGLSPWCEHVRMMDHRMNERGIGVDVPLLEKAQAIVDRTMADGNASMNTITDGAVDAVTSTEQLRTWISTVWTFTPSIDKATVDTLLARPDIPDVCLHALSLRKELSQSSVSKIDAMLRTNVNGRLCNQLRVFGADTGRWSANGVQVQNFPRGDWATKTAFADTFSLFDKGLIDDYDTFAAYVGRDHILPTLSSMLRGFLVPAPGSKFIVVDYAQVEARVSAWFAGEHMILDAFAKRRDLYKEVAAMIYDVPVAEVTSDMRFVGKQAVLGLSYGMGIDRFLDTCAKYNREVPREIAERTVAVYRGTYANITATWRKLEQAALKAVIHPETQHTVGAVKFYSKGNRLAVILPSGRPLWYNDVTIRMKTTQWGEKQSLFFWAVDSQTRHWTEFDIWGGTWLQQITQAASFDLMATAMLAAEEQGHRPVATIHDEIVAEVDLSTNVEHFIATTMAVKPAWAESIPLDFEGWEGMRYRK